MLDLPSTLSGDKRQKRERLHKLLGEMLINITNQVFRDRSFYIDGYRFINCSFINCNLYVNRGTFEFHRCREEGGNHTWDAEAMKCIQLYCEYGPSRAVKDSFKPVFHEDGTFSIGQGVSIG